MAGQTDTQLNRWTACQAEPQTNGLMDQHEGSFKIGKVLKEMYIDTALRKEKKMDSRNKLKSGKEKPPSSGKKVCYADYKASTKCIGTQE